MSELVVDASIVIKWVIAEEGTEEALALLRKAKLTAPDLVVPECANILWKKVKRGELTREQALLAARLLQGAGIEIFPSRAYLEAATRIALDLDHPAYDCLYIALAVANDSRLVTADEPLLRSLEERSVGELEGRVLSLSAAAGL